MTDLSGAVREMASLEALSEGRSCIHRRSAGAKLIFTLVFIVTVVSFPRNTLGGLLPFVFYPIVLSTLSETPGGLLFRRTALALPFAALAAISNLILLREPGAVFFGVTVSEGAISCVGILLRTFLCVWQVLLLVATTPFRELSGALRKIHLPDSFVTVLELTYRYASTLISEAGTMRTAYLLRAPGEKGVKLRHAGSFAGELLLRSFDRAERIYAAMLLRGFGTDTDRGGLRKGDGGYLLLTCVPCILLRIWSITAFWEAIL